MIAPPVFSAISIANEDLPDAVGPAIKIGLLSDRNVATVLLVNGFWMIFSASTPSLSLQQTRISDYLQQPHKKGSR